jgi:hypothetical protein
VGCCGLKNDPALWEKRNKRDTLSIEIAVDALKLGVGLVSSYYKLAMILWRIHRFAESYTVESCTLCAEWEQCIPTLYESNSRIIALLESIRDDYARLPGIFRIPFFHSTLIGYSDRLTDIFADRVEDLDFIKDEASRKSLGDLTAVCKEAAPKLDDWRKSMDFLN